MPYYCSIRLLCRKVILNKMEPAPRLGREPTPDSLALTKSYFAAADSYALPKLAIPERKAGYELLEIGIVEEGERKVIFEPENITLPPLGE